MLVPSTVKAASRFVARHHRHSRAPQGGLFACAVEEGGEIVGVAIAGRPIARMLQDGATVEVTRTCTTGARNANSMLYGGICRAAKALGYKRAITYTLAEEPGTSLLASGFARDAEVKAEASWSRPSRTRADADLYGETRPTGAKVRWSRVLSGGGERGAPSPATATSETEQSTGAARPPGERKKGWSAPAKEKDSDA